MSTIAGISSLGSSLYNLASTGGTPVAQTNNAGLAQTAVDLAAAGSVVATLGGGASAPLTYDAAGLLNTLVQAGTAPSSVPPASSSGSTPQSAQNSTDQAILNTLPVNAAAAGVYTPSGTLQALPPDTTANWANALKANPGLAATVAADSFNQGIVGTLSVSA